MLTMGMTVVDLWNVTGEAPNALWLHRPMSRVLSPARRSPQPRLRAPPLEFHSPAGVPLKRKSCEKISMIPIETTMMMAEMALISGVNPLRIAE